MCVFLAQSCIHIIQFMVFCCLRQYEVCGTMDLIFDCVHIHMYTFCLKFKRSTVLYEDVKVICEVMCSLVKQNFVC